MKPLCVIQSPLGTRSGYGDAARDIARHIIELGHYDVVLVNMPWGMTPNNALSADNPKDKMLIDRIATQPVSLPRQPELFIQVSVPNEFAPVGKYNIGVTAGIETTACSIDWLDGCNRMDVVWCMSEHAKAVFESTVADQRSAHGQVIRQVKLEKPVDVLPNCMDLSIFRTVLPSEIPLTVQQAMTTVTEKFNYLFVGHWLQGQIGEDRKNVGMLIKTFCETFKTVSSDKRPGLILKTSGAGFSILDQEEMLSRIQSVRQSVGPNCPNVYLLHGDLTEQEMNGLYNHPKVKVHVSFTKGEGFGRPLLEATMSKKPVMASGWSGHLDFLNPNDAILLSGELKPVHPSVVWNNVIIPESSWFTVDYNNAAGAMLHVFKHYDKFAPGAERLYKANRDKFGYPAIKQRTQELLTKYVPEFKMPSPLSLPKLKKLTSLP